MSTSFMTSASPNELRPDLKVIANWIAPSSRVLDLGCGDGALLAHLAKDKNCNGYGVEIDDAQVLACVKQGVNVVQQNIEEGLSMFGQQQFDVAVLSMSMQATKQTEQVLREMSNVARYGIVSFPNFGHWFHVWSILRGRMPVSNEMPYQWYNTPNVHLATVQDFEDFLGQLGLRIEERVFLRDGRPIRFMPGKRATQAIYRFCKP
jgi:methionine biosynthesis protein MetW